LDYEIIYRFGKLNSVADALSRRSDLKTVASSTLLIVSGTLPIANGMLSITDGTLSITNDTITTTNGTLPITNGTLPIANGTTPTINNTKSALKNKDSKSGKSQPVLSNEPPLKALPNLGKSHCSQPNQQFFASLERDKCQKQDAVKSGPLKGATVGKRIADVNRC
jgi:hypothetical protein